MDLINLTKKPENFYTFILHLVIEKDILKIGFHLNFGLHQFLKIETEFYGLVHKEDYWNLIRLQGPLIFIAIVPLMKRL